MSKYTISIKDKLQEWIKTGDLSDIETMREAAAGALFGGEINLIDPAYRDLFVTGFGYKFFKEEIGLETWPLWRMALVEKIYNNASYINLLYGNLDKQLMSRYHKSISEAARSRISSSVNNVNDDEKTKNDLSRLHSDVNDNENNGINSHSVDRLKTDVDETADSGNSKLSKNANNLVTRVDDETADNVNSGKDEVKHNASVNNDILKSDVSEDEGASNQLTDNISSRVDDHEDVGSSSGSKEGHGNESANGASSKAGAKSESASGSSKSGGTNEFSNTPQNGLQQVRDRRYLTNATITGEQATQDQINTGVSEEQTSDNSSRNSNADDINTGVTEATADNAVGEASQASMKSNANGQKSGASSEQGKQVSDGLDSTTYGKKENNVKDGASSESAASSSNESNDDTRNHAGSAGASESENGQDKSAATESGASSASDDEHSNGARSAARDGTGSETEQGNDNGTVEEFEMSFQLLQLAQPLLDAKLWPIFMDLFMMLL